MPEPIFMKVGMHITAPEPFSMAYIINPYHQSYPPVVARQRLDKNVTAENNSQTTEKLLGASVSMRSVSHQRKARD
jgi:hypothetical protein